MCCTGTFVYICVAVFVSAFVLLSASAASGERNRAKRENDDPAVLVVVDDVHVITCL